jgi:hypothetical protein
MNTHQENNLGDQERKKEATRQRERYREREREE